MDLFELDRQLQELAEDRRRRDKLSRDDQQLREQIRALEVERFGHQEQVGRAGEDLRRLEGHGLYSLFRSLLGDRHERIDEEREKLVRARLRHDECDESLQRLRAEHERVRGELEEYEDLDARCDELLAAKEAALRARGGDAAQQLVASSEALGELQHQRREVDEAIAAGHRVMAELKQAEADLGSARAWGRMDMMGGGLLTTMQKRSNVDRARRHVERAQRELHDFLRELRDVQAALPKIDIDIGGFLGFADYFLDGLFVDWAVQRRIVTGLDRVREVSSRVFELLMGLEQRRKQLQQQLRDAESARREWIESVGG
ncbi:MAG: hypothetical protein H6835_11010 [Planctomycetes bacterium]|nr:hypothetical protein [Planctomycetota bacterium]